MVKPKQQAEQLRAHIEEVLAGNRAALDRAMRENTEVRRERDRYWELFDFAPVPLLSLDPAGLIVQSNLAAARLLGRYRRQLEGRPLLVCVAKTSTPILLEHLRRCRHTEAPIRTEMELDAGGGETLPVELHSHRRPESPELLLTSMVDLSDRRRAELERQRVREAEAAARAKDRFLNMLSHELRTPLSPITNLVAVMQLRPDLPEAFLPLLATIERNLQLEVRLIDDLLDVSRIVRGKLRLELEAVDLHLMLKEVVAMCESECRGAGLDAHLVLDAGQPLTWADPTRIRQVFWNLVQNAVKFTPQGGRIWLRTANPEPGILAVTVRDSGTGIAPETLERIFEPFEQSEDAARGLGLGLAICKGVVEALGGSISAHSDGPGAGSTFTIRLPVLQV